MSDVVIRVENLCKEYRLGTISHGTLIHDLQSGWAKFQGKEDPNARIDSVTWEQLNNTNNSFCALKDVTFDVRQGEIVGIIGRNGAGKSTLLKIISRVTTPTSGTIKIKGRVASLLEVGTGFHPELTGGENIFLNGAILGMHRKEIEQKFNEIVKFAEIDKFIDTPVKRYSSGMYVRLAFAVAAHLDPEILIVDEVLAVGDIAFQKKCLWKMGKVAKGGRTVLFVSHNMGAIRSLCRNAIWIDKGRIIKEGTSDEVVRDYENKQLSQFEESTCIVERPLEDVKNLSFYFTRVEMLNTKEERTTIFEYNGKMVLLVDLAKVTLDDEYSAEFRIYNELEQLVSVGASGAYHNKYFSTKVRKIRIEIGPLIITSGKYKISFSVLVGRNEKRIDTWQNAIAFTIFGCRPFERGTDILSYREGVCVLGQSFSDAE